MANEIIKKIIVFRFARLMRVDGWFILNTTRETQRLFY